MLAGAGSCARRCISVLASLDSPHILKYAELQSQQMNLKYAFEFGQNLSEKKLVSACQYVQKELPIRLAKAVHLFQHLPYIVAVNPYMIEVLLVYLESFEALRKTKPVQNLQDTLEYTRYVQHVTKLHAKMFQALAAGIAEAKLLPKEISVSEEELDAFMDDFVAARLGRRVIVAHQITLATDLLQGGARPGHFGIFALECRPKEVIESAAAIVSEICSKRFKKAPTVLVSGDVDATISYIPDHLEYILIEILKNAMRHTVKWNMITGDKELPPIKVKIHAGNSVVLKITDSGGGFQGEELDHAWEWGGYSKGSKGSLDIPMELEMRRRTQRKESTAELVEQKKQEISRMMSEPTTNLDGNLKRWIHREHEADIGALTTAHHGLPLARAYSRYLGGDISISTVEGIGTSVYITLSSLHDSDVRF